MAKLGLPVRLRSLVLNHSPVSRGITKTAYNRYAYDKEKREALKAWEDELKRLANAAPGRTCARSRGVISGAQFCSRRSSGRSMAFGPGHLRANCGSG